MTDLCKTAAQQVVNCFGLSTTDWVWNQQEEAWEWLPGREYTELRTQIDQYIHDIVAELEESSTILEWLTSSDYDAVREADDPLYVLSGDERSLQDVLSSILKRTISDLVEEEIVPKPLGRGDS